MLTNLWLWSITLSLILFHRIQRSITLADANDSDFTLIICHRKVQPGRKMVKLLTERVVDCENLQDCCRACAYEKSFACTGFNYRHRTDGSQCTCELTSTPYSRMDAEDDFLHDMHYDYYAREQNCPSSAQPDDASYWKDRTKLYERTNQNTWSDQKKENDDRLRDLSISIARPIYRENHPPNREITDGRAVEAARSREQFHQDGPRDFTARQNTPNWNDNWKIVKNRYSDVVNENKFAEHRINYEEESYAAVRPSTSIKPRLDDEPVPGQNGFSISNTNSYLHGRYLNYGSAFEHNDNKYAPVEKQSPLREHDKLRTKCSIKVITGSKLSRNVVRKTCLTHDLEQCEQLCINETEFPCESFAYRYSVLITNPTDNCLLSDLSYQRFNFYTDLEPDRDYNSYVVVQDAKVCYPKKSPGRFSSEECFSRIRSGFAIPLDITKKLLFANDLGECQLACITSQEFVCKSFAFKHVMDYRRHVQERGAPNCFLSDWSSEEMNPVNMPDLDGAELYERNSFSYGCEMYLFPLSMSNIIPSNGKGSSSIRTDDLCYLEHHRPCKLMPHAIVTSTRANTRSECQQKCSATRNTGVTRCMSFNYIIVADNVRDNCILSDISMQDLRPNLDYIYDRDHVLYTWKDFDPYCSLTINNHHTTYPLDGDSPDATHDYGVRNKGKFEFDSHQHDVKNEPGNIENRPLNEAADFEHDFAFFHSTEHSTFQRYTVNGYPCKNGTTCQRNEITGFWSCETEQGEYGNWDYCCEPNHRCGFSQGYHYPWCYVGLNEDQWRPCSETYYPYYLFNNRSFYRQSSRHVARHWPLIYFHEDSPPNCSIDSSNEQHLDKSHRFDYRTNSRNSGLH